MYLRELASRAFTLLAKNPPLFGRMMVAKANTLRPIRRIPAMRYFGDVLFELDASQNGSTAAMFFGSFCLLVVDAMKRHLRCGDVFIDVGANVGYLSAVGAELVGRNGEVHSFEPVPRYFQRLRRLAELNPGYSIATNACAVGSAAGSVKIHITREPGQNTLVPDYKSGPEVVSELDVPIIRLDSYIASRRIPRVALIKIDAEGFELPVLEGLSGYFQTAGELPVIICEIAPRAYPLMGRSISELSRFMSEHGYTARDIIDGATRVDLATLRHVTDVLFLPEP